MDQQTAHRIEVLEAEIRYLRQALRALSNEVMSLDSTDESNWPVQGLALTALDVLEHGR